MNILELFGLKKKPAQAEQAPAPAQAAKPKAPAQKKPAAKMQSKPKAGRPAATNKPVKKAAGRGR